MRRAFVVLFLLLVTLLAVAVYTLKIDQISVEGLQNLPARAIVDASQLRLGERILWVRLSVAEHNIEQIPAVASVVADRSLPGTIVLHVTERVPVAVLGGTQGMAVDDTGREFQVTGGSLPTLNGWHGTAKPGAIIDARSRSTLSAIRSFPLDLRRRITVISIGPSIVMRIQGGAQIRFGANSDLVAKAQVADTILAAHGKPLAYIDVSSPTTPVSRDVSTPAPTPTPAIVGAPVNPVLTPQPTPPPTPYVVPNQ